MRNGEINEKTEADTRESKISEKLCIINRVHLFDSLDFNDNTLLYKKIQP